MNQLTNLLFREVIERRHPGRGHSRSDDASESIVIETSEHFPIEQAGRAPTGHVRAVTAGAFLGEERCCDRARPACPSAPWCRRSARGSLTGRRRLRGLRGLRANSHDSADEDNQNAQAAH
jgi:hypothetical protein